MRYKNRLACMMLALCTNGVTAQQSASVEQALPEEIVVTGERTLSGLRFQMDRAQDDIYRLFNQLLDDSRFKINCNTESSTGSYILQRKCEPAFLANERARYAAQTVAAWRSGEDPSLPPTLAMEMALATGRVSDEDLKFDMTDQYEKMNQHMYELAMSNTELQQALLKLAALQADYVSLEEQQKSRRQADSRGGILCGIFSRACRKEGEPTP